VEFAHYLGSPISLAVDLVNSSSPVSRREDLVDSDALASFLWEHQVSHEDPPTDEDLDQVRQVRARLREVFQAHDHETAARLVNRLLTDSRASPQLTNHDANPWHLHYTPPQTPLGPRLAANAAVALALVIAEAGFDRLRVCEGERCKDVFVDRSRNRSRRYCSPQVCGNRASVAAYRARQRAASPPHRGDPDHQDRPDRTAAPPTG
jgi:predicted RNA-binding Zn ribbon-like protein